MDLVQLHTDERLDVPDATAATATLPTSEARRLVRELLGSKFAAYPATSESTTVVRLPIMDVESIEGVFLDGDYGRSSNYFTGGSFQVTNTGTKITLGTALSGSSTKVIVDFTASASISRAFLVRPTVPPSSAITVLRGAGIGSESLLTRLGQNSLDYGQLLGGEGQATRSFDFTGFPAATYWVGVQFTYTAGRSDNRAFWDPLVAAEATKTVNTRWVVGWNVVIGQIPAESGSAIGAMNGAVKVGTVVWNGATVNSTDIRQDLALDCLFEGSRTYTGTNSTYHRPHDFSRADNRHLAGVGSLRQWMSAVMRIVEELKHYDLATARWYTKLPFTVADATDGVTVGDGVTSRGHYNASDYAGDLGQALNAALVSPLPMAARKRIKILHGAYTLSTQVTIPLGSHGATILGSGKFSTKIDVAAGLAVPAIKFSGTMSATSWNGVEIGDLTISKLNGADARCIDLESNNGVNLRRVKIRDIDFAAASGDSSGLAMLRLASDPSAVVPIQEVSVERCRFAGATSKAIGISIVASGATVTATGGTVVRDCEFYRIGRGIGATLIRGLRVESCWFQEIDDETAQDHGVKLTSCMDASVSNCKFIDLTAPGIWSSGTGNFDIRGCQFKDTSGAEAIKLDSASRGVTISGCYFQAAAGRLAELAADTCQHLTISGCVFDAPGVARQQIRLINCDHFAVQGCTLHGENTGLGLLRVEGASSKIFTIDGCVVELTGADTIGMRIDPAARRGAMLGNQVHDAVGAFGTIQRPHTSGGGALSNNARVNCDNDTQTTGKFTNAAVVTDNGV